MRLLPLPFVAFLTTGALLWGGVELRLRSIDHPASSTHALVIDQSTIHERTSSIIKFDVSSVPTATSKERETPKIENFVGASERIQPPIISNKHILPIAFSDAPDWRDSVHPSSSGLCDTIAPVQEFVEEMLIRFHDLDPEKVEPGALTYKTSYERRIAFVAGNGDYENYPALKNPENDAWSVSRALSALGFAVHVGIDLNKSQIQTCLDDFYKDSEGADTALLYYAGHGFSLEGENYLLPINALRINDAAQAQNFIAIVDILDEMRSRANSSFLFLDAGRNSLGRSFTAIRTNDANGGSGGTDRALLSRPGIESTLPKSRRAGYYYVFAAAPGTTASDGDNDAKHSPFTQAFLDNIGASGQIIQELIIGITRDVFNNDGRQIPFSEGFLLDDVYLNGRYNAQDLAAISYNFAHDADDQEINGALELSLATALKGLPRIWPDKALGKYFGPARASLFRILSEWSDNLDGHSDAISCASTSLSDSRALTSSDDGTVKVWDSSNGRQLAVLTGNGSPVNCAEFNPDGTKIVSASDDGFIRIWNAISYKLIRAIKAHNAAVNTAAFDPTGSRIVTASNDNTAKLWDAESGQLRFSITGHKDNMPKGFFTSDDMHAVNSANFSPTGDRILTASSDGSFGIWSSESGAELLRIETVARVIKAKFTPSGNYVVTASYNHYGNIFGFHADIEFWDAETGERIRELGSVEDRFPLKIFDFALSPNGGRVATAAPDRAIEVWDLLSGGKLFEIGPPDDGATNVAFVNNGEKLLVGYPSGDVRTYSINIGKPVFIRSFSFVDVQFRMDSNQFVAVDDNGKGTYATINGPWVRNGTIMEDDYTVTYKRTIDLSDDGMRVVSMSRQAAHVWDLSTREKLFELESSYGTNSVYFFDESRKIIGASSIGLQIWDAMDGRLISQITKEPYLDVSVSPNNEMIATASHEGIAYLLDGKTGKVVNSFSGHTDSITVVNFSPDGERIVTASTDRSARVWDVETGESTAILHGHFGAVSSVEFSADGLRIVTTSTDRTTRVWDADSGDELMVLRGHRYGVKDAAIAPSNDWVLTTDGGSIRYTPLGTYGQEFIDAARTQLSVHSASDVERERVRYWNLDEAAFQ